MPTTELEDALQDLERLTALVENSSADAAVRFNLELQDSILRVQRLLESPTVNKGRADQSTSAPTLFESHIPAVPSPSVFLPLVSAGPLKFGCSSDHVAVTASPMNDYGDNNSESCSGDEPWLQETPCQLRLGEQYQSSLSSLAACMNQLDPSTEGWRMLSRLISAECELCEEVIQGLGQRTRLIGEREPVAYTNSLTQLAAAVRALNPTSFAATLQLAIDEELSLLSGIC